MLSTADATHILPVQSLSFGAGGLLIELEWRTGKW